jgi:hypothetical protein
MKMADLGRGKELKTMDTDSSKSSMTTLLWKIPAIAVAYFAGKLIAAALVTSVGFRFPEIPGHTWVPALDFLGGVVLVVCLAFLARGIGGSLTKRWLILLAFTYVSFVINNQIETVVFNTHHEVPTLLLFFIIPCVVVTGVTVALIKPPNGPDALTSVFADRPIRSWWWRLLLAWLAFPIIYYFFGALIYPLVADVYTQQDSGFQLPGPLVVLGAVSVRSLLFLVSAIPILVNWQRSRRSLVLSLAAALAAMVGVAGMFENTLMPTQMKIAHSLEIIADSLVHAWVLVALLVAKPSPVAAENIPIDDEV